MMSLPNRAAVNKTVTIAANEKLYEKFRYTVEKIYGFKKESRVIEMLVKDFIETAGYSFKIDFSEQKIVKRTLSIGHELWEDFSVKLDQLFGKKKIKSLVIDRLIDTFVQDKMDKVMEFIKDDIKELYKEAMGENGEFSDREKNEMMERFTARFDEIVHIFDLTGLDIAKINAEINLSRNTQEIQE